MTQKLTGGCLCGAVRYGGEAQSTLGRTASGLPDVILLTAGSLDDSAVFSPSMVVFTESAQPWDMLDPQLQRFPRMSET